MLQATNRIPSTFNMQAAAAAAPISVYFAQSPSFRFKIGPLPAPAAAWSSISIPALQTSQCPKKKKKIIKVIAAAAHDTTSTTVDYNAMTSVFPAEACETIGGEACDVEMYPEVKLTPDSKSNNKATSTGSEMVDRDYLDYNTPKTVFPGEACDDLGGEFCEPEYQTGVY